MSHSSWSRPAILALLPLVSAVSLAACRADVAEPDPDTTTYDFYAPGTVASRFAQPGKTYLPRRPIATLTRLGALDGPKESVARRIDGIIANRPADGAISIDELVRAEQGDKWPGFLDEEQALFPALWALMVGPDGKGPDMAPRTPISHGEDLSTSASSAVPVVMKVAELPAELQTAAKRLERLFDKDGDDATVAVEDADAAIAQPAAFTPAEVEDIRKIAALLRSRATNTAGRAIVRVLAPGQEDFSLFDDRGLKIVEHRTVSFSGVRKVQQSLMASFRDPRPVQNKVTMKVERAVDFFPPEGVTIVVVRSDGMHCLYAGATRITTSTPSCGQDTPVAIEHWKGGTRIDGAFTRLDWTSSWTADVDLSVWADYDFVLADGTQLVQNWTRTVPGTGYDNLYGATAEFVYERTARKVAGVDDAIVARLAPPAFKLPFGRYRTKHGDEVFEVEVRANGVVHAGVERGRPPATLERLWPVIGDGDAKAWARVPAAAFGFPADYIERPGLRPDGTVLLSNGFPVLTAANRL